MSEPGRRRTSQSCAGKRDRADHPGGESRSVRHRIVRGDVGKPLLPGMVQSEQSGTGCSGRCDRLGVEGGDAVRPGVALVGQGSTEEAQVVQSPEGGVAVNPGGGEGVQLGGGARSTRWSGDQPREARSRALTRSAGAAREKGGARVEAGFLQGSSKAPPMVWDRRRQGESFLPHRRFGLGEQARLELDTGRLSGVGVNEVGVAGRGVNPRFRCEGHVNECGW